MARVKTSPRRPPAARLRVSDFGPIVEGNIELKPLTVFVGPSNTGKSLLSVLIYVLHRWLGAGDTVFRYRNDSLWVRSTRLNRVSRNEIGRLQDSVGQWLRTVHEDSESSSELPQSVVAFARSSLTRSELGSYFTDELVRCFGIDNLSQLIRHGKRRSANFTLSTLVDQENNEWFKFGADIRGREFAWRSSIPEGSTVRLGSKQSADHIRDLPILADDDTPNYILHDILNRVTGELARQCVGQFSSSAHYLPADRTGIMHAHRVVVRSLIRRSSRAGLRMEEPLPVLSGVVTDFLERIVDMPHRPARRRMAYEGLATQLEESVLGGSINVDVSETGYPSFLYRPNGWRHDLPLMNASSMVSEVAPVVLYLRNVVHIGDTLIVEEPESHLHPAKQVELTHQLAAAVHAGVRVVLTTHSEWVLEALANLVRLSGLSKSKQRGIAGAEHALSKDQVGAWMFKAKLRPKGSVVEEIPLDTDAGTFPAGYGEITESLYNEWATINNRIEMEKHR